MSKAIDEDRDRRRYAGPLLALLSSLLLVFAVWRVWGRPYFLLNYYRVATVSTARQGLQANDDLVRGSAARGLGPRGAAARDAVSELMIALNDESPAVAAGAAASLGNIMQQLRKSDPLQDAVVAALVTSLHHSEVRVRNYSAYALSLMKRADASAIAQLTVLLQDHNASAYMAARALGNIGSQARGSIPNIVPLLSSSHAGERAEALAKLQPLPDDVVVNIEHLPNDEVDFVRRAAQKAMQKIPQASGRR
jgi:HEAT repeat protein